MEIFHKYSNYFILWIEACELVSIFFIAGFPAYLRTEPPVISADIVPVAVVGSIVDVKFTGFPDIDGFCDDDNVVVVVIWFTFCVIVLDVLDRSLVSSQNP